MLFRLSKFWWLLILRGLISIFFAIVAFLNPQLAFEAIILLLGILLLADGATAGYLGVRMRGHADDWWVSVLEGALGVGLGLVALLNPELTAAGLVLVLAVWFLVTGVFEIALAIKLRKEYFPCDAASSLMSKHILINAPFSYTFWYWSLYLSKLPLLNSVNGRVSLK